MYKLTLKILSTENLIYVTNPASASTETDVPVFHLSSETIGLTSMHSMNSPVIVEFPSEEEKLYTTIWCMILLCRRRNKQ
jgi:hypothetical protein